MMMMPVPAAPENAGPCPSDEEIAAFIDGRLHGEERKHLLDHLASCKACYEVFAGVMSFEQEVAGAGNEGRIVPFPVAKREEKEREEGRRRGRWPIPRWAAAAAAVLVIGIAYEGYRTLSGPPPMTVAGLVGPLLSVPGAAQNFYPLVGFRGAQSPEDVLARDRPSFRVGVLLVDLRLALHTKDQRATVSDLLARLGNEIEDAGFSDELATSYRQDALKAKGSDDFVRQVEADFPRRESELDSSVDGDALAFGKWAEASRLAALTRTPEVFTNRNNRSFLTRILARTEKEVRSSARSEDETDLKAERDAAVLATLKRIAAAWKPGEAPQSFEDLAKALTDLIGQYDR